MKTLQFIEKTLLYALTIIFAYYFFELLFSVNGSQEASPTSVLPFRVNETVLLVSLLASGVFGIFFPLWNVGRYLNTQNVKEMMEFKRLYRIDYLLLCIGFLGLACWMASDKPLDAFWWMGSVLVLFCIILIISISLSFNPKKKKTQ